MAQSSTTSLIEDLIRQLEAALVQQYGGSFSYQISAQHRLIAAHNYRPTITWDEPKEK